MTGDLDIDQFKQLLVNIDAAADEVESSMEEKEEEEEEEEAVVESKTESSEEEGEEFDEEELTKEIFEELSGGKEKVSVQVRRITVAFSCPNTYILFPFPLFYPVSTHLFVIYWSRILLLHVPKTSSYRMCLKPSLTVCA